MDEMRRKKYCLMFWARALTAALMLAMSCICAYASSESALDVLMETAERSSPLIKAAHERVLRANAALREAGAKMGPSVTAAAGGMWQQNDPLLAAVNPVTNTMIGVVPFGFRNTYVAAVDFLQTVYSGGSLTAGRQAAELARDALTAEEKRVRQSVRNSVRVAYFNVRRAQEKRTVAEESLKLAQEHLNRAEKLFAAGVVAKSDVLRSKTAVAESKLNLIRADNAVEISLTALERAVGTAVDETHVKNGDPDAESLAHLQPKYADPVSAAYENREDLKMYGLLSRQADKTAKAQRGQLLPQIKAGGMLANIDDEFLPDGDEEWRLGLFGTWTVFDGGEISAKAEQSRAQAREFLYRLDDMKKTVKMEVTQAQSNLRFAESRLDVAARQVEVSEEDYRIAVKRYEAQVGTNLDMLDARLALTNSRTERVDALYDIEIAIADLIYAVGAD